MIRITPALSDRATKHSRATAYRLIRHMLVNPQSVERLQEQSLDWYIVRYVNLCLKRMSFLNLLSGPLHAITNTQWRKSKSSNLYEPSSRLARPGADQAPPWAAGRCHYRTQSCARSWRSPSTQTNLSGWYVCRL